MPHQALTYWQSFPALVVGAFTGLLTLVALKVGYYASMQFESGMHPSIGFFFTPGLLAVVLLAALPVEALFRRWHKPSSYLQAGLIGASYATLFSWWAFPAHQIVFLAVNPLILRAGLAVMWRSQANKRK